MTSQTPTRKSRSKSVKPAATPTTKATKTAKTSTDIDTEMVIASTTTTSTDTAEKEQETDENMSSSAAASVTTVGGSLADRAGVFCAAIGALAVPCGGTIVLIHVSTGNTLRTLRGHKGRVTGLVLPPSNRYQLLTSSTDGTVKTWDLQDGACLATVSLSGRVTFLGIGASQPRNGNFDSRVFYAIVDRPSRPASTTTTSVTTTNSPSSNPVQVLVRCVQKTPTGKKAAHVSIQEIWSVPFEPRNKVGELVGGMPVRGLSVQPSVLPESKQGHADIIAVVTHREVLVWTCTMGPKSETATVVASTLDVLKPKSNKIVSTVRLAAQLSNAAEISALAIHPTSPCLAIGDLAGRITVHQWGGAVVQVGGLPKQHTSTVLHWHSHSVAGLDFNSDGHYLLSGGQEAVLVVWQLGTGKKSFLPRLGGAVGQISGDSTGSLCAVSLLDNSIRLVDISALEQRWRFFGLQMVNHRIKMGGLKRSRESSLRATLGLVFEPRNGNIVVQGLPGQLQLYDVNEDQHRMLVNVSERGLISRTNSETLAPTEVNQVAFNAAGTCMATAESRNEVRDDAGRILHHAHLTLRFWDYDVASGRFVLTTYVDSPHKAGITSLVFHPRRDLVVSTSLDKTFNVWQRTVPVVRSTKNSGAAADSKNVARATTWACRSVGFYRGMPASDAALAPDGSLLAVVYDQVVTLWDPISNTLQAGLTHTSHTVSRVLPNDSKTTTNADDHEVGTSDASVRKVAFAGTDLPYLVSHTAQGLFVWNLLSCTVAWSLGLDVEAMAVDPSGSGRFVVATSLSSDASELASALVVFQHDSPVPLQVLKVSGQSITSLAFHPSTQADTPACDFEFVALNSASKLIRISRENASSDDEAGVKSIAKLEEGPSHLALMFGEGDMTTGSATASGGATSKRSSSSGRHDAEDVLGAYPSHLMPPAHLVFAQLVKALYPSTTPDLSTVGKKRSESVSLGKEIEVAPDTGGGVISFFSNAPASLANVSELTFKSSSCSSAFTAVGDDKEADKAVVRIFKRMWGLTEDDETESENVLSKPTTKKPRKSAAAAVVGTPNGKQAKKAALPKAPKTAPAKAGKGAASRVAALRDESSTAQAAVNTPSPVRRSRRAAAAGTRTAKK